jgi:hypothetical protein
MGVAVIGSELGVPVTWYKDEILPIGFTDNKYATG